MLFVQLSISSSCPTVLYSMWLLRTSQLGLPSVALHLNCSALGFTIFEGFHGRDEFLRSLMAQCQHQGRSLLLVCLLFGQSFGDFTDVFCHHACFCFRLKLFLFVCYCNIDGIMILSPDFVGDHLSFLAPLFCCTFCLTR